MSSNDFDAVIIGAGPAGSHAAERLAGAGARVALIDGRPTDHAKPCGGGVTSKALNAWPHLHNAVGRRIDKIDLYSPSGKRIHLNLNQPFAVYSRTAFDSYLRDRACDAGAEVFSQRVSFHSQISRNGSWKIDLNDKTAITTPLLIAADGANSAIAKSLAGPLAKSDMEVAFGYRAPLPKGDDVETVVAFLPGFAGYAWAFPRIDHISFGIATSQDRFDRQRLNRMMWDFMIGYYRMRRDPSEHLWSPRVRNESRDLGIRESIEPFVQEYAARIPGLSPETLDRRPAAGDGWALLGDAAGFADSVTGEGIFYALRSSDLFVDSFVAGRPTDYESRWRDDFGRELRRASQMRRKFYGTFLGAPFSERMIQFARLHPGIRGVLKDLIAGDQGYIDLKRKLARSMLWPL